MSGTFGYELDLNKLSKEEKVEISQQIKDFKRYYWLIQDGDYYRLTDTEAGHFYSAWQFVSKDGSESLVNLVVNSPQPNSLLIHVRLKGLEPEGVYEMERTGQRFTGAALMYGGYTFPLISGDYPAMQIHFTKVQPAEQT